MEFPELSKLLCSIRDRCRFCLPSEREHGKNGGRSTTLSMLRLWLLVHGFKCFPTTPVQFEFACFNQQRYVPAVVMLFLSCSNCQNGQRLYDRVLYLPHSTKTAVFAFLAKMQAAQMNCPVCIISCVNKSHVSLVIRKWFSNSPGK